MSKFGGIPLDGGSKFGGIPLEQSQPIDDDVPQLDAQGNLIDTYQPPEQPERTAGDVAKGIYETGRSMVQGAAGTPLYVAGAIEGIYKRFTEDGFSPEDAAKYANEAAAYFVTPPESQTGKDIAGFIGDVGGALPPVLGVAAGAIPNVATGFQGARVVKDAASAKAIDVADKLPQRQSPILPREKRTQALIAQLEAKQGSASTVGSQLEARPKAASVTGKVLEKIKLNGPKVVDAPLETKAVSQGFDQGIIGMIKDSDPLTKNKMQKMLDFKKRGIDQPTFAVRNPTMSIVGDSLMERVNTVIGANKSAGQGIGKIAKENLTGKPIDISEASMNFNDGLDGVGVALMKAPDGNIKADYTNSILPKGDRGAINEVIRVMNIKGRGGIDALKVHEMKKIMDNHISYGKTKDGLSRDAENILKDYRRGLDDQLDEKFPEYNNANIAFKETIEAIEAFQQVAGKKLDLTSPSARNVAGQEMRKILSNYGTKQRLIDAADKIEDTANKYKGYGVSSDGRLLIEDLNSGSSKFKDNLVEMTLFANELDGRFVPDARGGFENLTTRKAQRAAQAMASPTGSVDAAIQGAGALYQKVKGVTDETAFNAMYELLRNQQ